MDALTAQTEKNPAAATAAWLREMAGRLAALEREEAQLAARRERVLAEALLVGCCPRTLRRAVEERRREEAAARDEARLTAYRAALGEGGEG